MSSKIIFSKSFFINLIILLIPINFILGNLLLNLNVIILITLALFFYGLDIFKIKFDNIDRLILIFFLYLFINGIVNNYLVREDDFIQDTILIKTLAYSRYLLLYFVVRFLVIRKIINFKRKDQLKTKEDVSIVEAFELYMLKKFHNISLFS